MTERTTYTKRFKVIVLGEYFEGRSVVEICRRYLIDRSSITDWRRELGMPKREGLAASAYHSQRRANHTLVEHLWSTGLDDYAIGRELGVARSSVQRARKQLGLAANYQRGWVGTNAVRYGTALAVLLFASGAQAQGGWMPHPLETPDPFAGMRNIAKGEPGFGCCSGRDCAYTEQCTPVGGGHGVIGPDQQCHEIPENAYRVRGCAVGQTSACFVGQTLICACLGDGT